MRPLSGRLGWILAAALAGLPFAVFAIVRYSGPVREEAWPVDVAVAAATGGELRDFALLHFDSGPRIIRFPVNTVLDIPAVGQVRALTAYRIGGATRLAQGLAATLSIDVPYGVSGDGDDVLDIAAVPVPADAPVHRKETWKLLQSAAGDAVTIVKAPGTEAVVNGQPSFVIEPSFLGGRAGAIVAPSPEPATSTAVPGTPGPTFSPLPARLIKVDVLNAVGGGSAAGDLARELRAAGYTTGRVADVRGQSAVGRVVYYRGPNGEAAGAQVALQVGAETPPAPLPSSITSTSDVVVVIGTPTATSPSPSPRPRASPTRTTTRRR